MNDKNYSIDTVDFIIIATLIGGYLKDVWWPFWFFLIIHSVATAIGKKNSKPIQE